MSTGGHAELEPCLRWVRVRFGGRFVADSRRVNLLCFFDERVEAVYVDGERQPRPRTRWSVPE